MLLRTEVTIQYKCKNTNKKGTQKTHLIMKNIIRPVIRQLNTFQGPKISNSPKNSSSPSMNMLWEVLTLLLVRIFQKITKPLKEGNFNYKILLQHCFFTTFPPRENPYAFYPKGNSTSPIHWEGSLQVKILASNSRSLKRNKDVYDDLKLFRNKDSHYGREQSLFVLTLSPFKNWLIWQLTVAVKWLIFNIWEVWLRSLSYLKEYSFQLKTNSLWLFPTPYFWAKITQIMPLLQAPPRVISP